MPRQRTGYASNVWVWCGCGKGLGIMLWSEKIDMEEWSSLKVLVNEKALKQRLCGCGAMSIG